MIDLTVKTLDSQNHPFHVEDDITIRQFKEKISDCLNIPPDSQRLIFCGRVLQDDKKLSEYGLVTGNTVHMVQRPPPQSTGGSRSQTRDSGTGTSTSSTGSRNGGIRRSHTFRMRPSGVDRNAMYLGAMAYPADLMEAQGIQLPQPSSSLCASRLNIARRMLRRAGDVLLYLEDPHTRPPPRNTPSPTTVQVSQAIEVIEVGIGQMDDSMEEGGNIAEAATAAAISAAVSAAQEVGAPNIRIFRGSNNTPGGSNETVIHIEATDNSEPQDDTMVLDSTVNDNSNATAVATEPEPPGCETVQPDAPGHSRSSSTDSFSSASEFPVAGAANNQTNVDTSTVEQEMPDSTTGPRPPNESGTPPNTPLAPLAALLDELNAVQTRLQPFMMQYHNILLTDPTYPDQAATTSAQRVYNRVSQVLHLLSHAYHAISDLMVDLNTPAPRYLRCRPILIQHSAVVQTGIPIQAEFNLSNIMAEAAAATGHATRTTAQPRNSETQTSTATARTVGRESESSSPTTPTATATATAESTTPVVHQATTHQQPTSVSFQHGAQHGAQQGSQHGAQHGSQHGSQHGAQHGSHQGGTHRHNFGFSLPDGLTMGGNVEVVMEVTPRYGLFNPDTNSGSAPTASGATGGMGVTIPIQGVAPSSEMMSNIMQAVAGQIMNRMHGGGASVNVQANTQTGQARTQTPSAEATTTGREGQSNANQPGQNSQARVNTATHPTTSTQTRSTARPHVQLRPAQLRLPLGGHLGGVTSSFDPFLPCNSHHLRARRRTTTNNGSSGSTGSTNTANNNNNNENAANSGPHISIASVVSGSIPCQCSGRRPPVPNRGASETPRSSSSQAGAPRATRRTGDNAPAALLRDVFASQIVTDTLQNAFVEVLDNAQDSGNLILDFIMQLVRRTPLNEVFTMLMGDPSPLVRLQPIIRQFLTTRLLNTSNPTRETFVQATERIIDGIRDHFQMIETLPMRNNIDLSATLLALTRDRVPTIISMAVDDDTSPRYGTRLMHSVRDFVSVFVGTVMHCCENGAQGAEEVFRRYVDYVSRGADANLLMFTMSYSLPEFRNYMSTVDMTHPDIQRFIVYRNQDGSSSGAASQQPQSMEVEEIPAPRRSRDKNIQTSLGPLRVPPGVQTGPSNIMPTDGSTIPRIGFSIRPTNNRSTGGSTVVSGDSTGTQTSAATGAQTGTQTGAPTGTQTGTQTGAQTGTQTGVLTGTQTRAPTGAQTGAQTGTQTGVQTGTQTGDSTIGSTVVNTQPLTGARNVIKIPKTPEQANDTVNNVVNAAVNDVVNDVNHPVVILPPIEMDLDAAEPVANAVLGSQPWHNALPADWVPIITRDAVRQRRQVSQSPMSDAYLQGMPSKRRKLISADKPVNNVVQSLQDTVRNTIQSAVNQPTSNTGASISEIVAQAANDNNLLNAYREQIRSSLRNRLQQDPDFNPALYPNSEQKFK